MTSQHLARLAITSGLGIAAGIHLAVAAGHDLATVHGAFFASAGMVQGLLAVLSARALTRAVVVAAGTSSATLLGIWFVERVARSGSENPALLDTVASACEVIVVVAAVALLPRTVVRAATLPRSIVLAVLGVATALSLAAAPSEHDHRGEADEARTQTRYDELLVDHHAPTSSTDAHVTGESHDH